jgi:N-acetylmuramoyl-L-alanine amidase
MSTKLKRASVIAVVATLITTIAAADQSSAADKKPGRMASQSRAVPRYVSQPVVQPLPAERIDAPAEDAAPVSARSLASLVSAQPQSGDLPRELNCLAGAIYFEAKSESLTGQLAVGRVVVARSKSGRFPNSYCGVVFQPSQFSFVRGGSMPGIDRRSRQWRNAVAIAQISHAGSWRSPAEGALYFHAARVSPGWRLTRVARVENHVFYR